MGILDKTLGALAQQEAQTGTVEGCKWRMTQRHWDELRKDAYATTKPAALPDKPDTLWGLSVELDEDAPAIYLTR